MNNIKELVDSSRFVNLLYVEDNLATREAASSFFKDFFDNIIVSENGEKGLEQFILNKIDIVITDIRMPIMNGLEMIESIRRIDSEVPILIFSGQDESPSLKKSINLIYLHLYILNVLFKFFIPLFIIRNFILRLNQINIFLSY